MAFIFSLLTLLGIVLTMLGLGGSQHYPSRLAVVGFGQLLMVVGLIGLCIDRLFGRTRIDRRTDRVVREP